MIRVTLEGTLTPEDEKVLREMAKEFGIPFDNVTDIESFMVRWINAFANDRPETFIALCRKMGIEGIKDILH